LRDSTGSPAADEQVRRVVGAFEAAFPGRVRGYYVIGSYADGSAVRISDLDLVVLFKSHIGPAEQQASRRVARSLGTSTLPRLDLTVSGEAEPTWEKAHVKLASRHVYGEGIRADIPDELHEPAETRDSYHYAQRYLRFLRGGAPLTYPLDYPDPAGELFGYDAVREPEWYPPGTVRGLRELVNAVTLLAKALLPSGDGYRSASKGQTVTLYREYAGGGAGSAWGAFVDALYRHAKLRWGYLVPDDSAERRVLRELCRQTLGFENHFLARYRTPLLDLLQSRDEASQRFAAARLEEVTYLEGAAPVRQATSFLDPVDAAAPSVPADRRRRRPSRANHAISSAVRGGRTSASALTVAARSA
jgi:hypothetical protein